MRRLAVICLIACKASAHVGPDATPDGASDGGVAGKAVTITAQVTSTRFVVREHMLAAGEMQISGEPLAETMGRDLHGYSRDQIPVDLYNDATLGTAWIDLAGYSTAVESYEYSKQPMNNLAFEAGAGTSLVFAPLVNPSGATGATANALLAAKVRHFAEGANTLGSFVFPAGTYPTNNPSGNTNPNGAGNPAHNPLGWPGIWPTAHVYRSFDPTIDPTSAVDLGCAISSDDTPASGGPPLNCADYECEATTLHLRDRAAQIDPTITPGADGFSAWKYGLWVLNYLQVMHDSAEAPLVTVAEGDLPNVGKPGNTVTGIDEDGMPTAPGTYLGSSRIEGFQAEMFILEVDARAHDWLTRLSTADGATLSGFASTAAAIAYDYTAPLRWFPARIAVTETADASGFPRPAFALGSADSDALDLVGLAMGYAEFFALTDRDNRDVGGAQSARAMFDGDPFPADDQLADGEATLHDRALAMMRVALIDLDRMHTDPASGIVVDHATATGRGTTLSATTAAYTVIGLRTVLRALSSQLELYSNNTPDTAITRTRLDAAPIHYPGNAALLFSARLEQMLVAHANLLYDHLTDASGRAWTSWDVAAGAPVDQTDVLDAHTAAVRGLFAAYLATGDTRYRTRAIAVFDRIQRVFWDADARIYTALPAPTDGIEYTPLRFALLQSTLRDMYELVATRPGGEALAPLLEERLARVDKLILNGWDDRNHDRRVDSLFECISFAGQQPHGALQMAERTLSGEIGRGGEPGHPQFPTLDRDDDCVPETDDAHLPAGLADAITFTLTRSP